MQVATFAAFGDADIPNLGEVASPLPLDQACDAYRMMARAEFVGKSALLPRAAI